MSERGRARVLSSDDEATPRLRDERLQRLFTGMAADATRFDFYYALRYVDAQLPGDTPLGRGPRPLFKGPSLTVRTPASVRHRQRMPWVSSTLRPPLVWVLSVPSLANASAPITYTRRFSEQRNTHG